MSLTHGQWMVDCNVWWSGCCDDMPCVPCLQAHVADQALAQASQALASLPLHYRAFYAARGMSRLMRGLGLPPRTLDTWSLASHDCS